jgi:hypothetical protein
MEVALDGRATKPSARVRSTETLPAVIPPPGASPEQPQIKAWALVELFGHQRIVGHCTSEAFGSAVLLRVDVPDLTKNGKVVRPGFTRYFGMGAIYSVTPLDEERARALLPAIDGTPAQPLTISSYRRDYGEGDEP